MDASGLRERLKATQDPNQQARQTAEQELKAVSGSKLLLDGARG